MSAETVTEAGERAKAGADSPGLRAYLPTRQLARALCSGSAVLIGKGWAWITAEGAKEAGSRLLYSALGLYAGVYLAHTNPQIVMPVAVVGWIAGALMFAPSPPPPGKARPRVDLTKQAVVEDARVEDQDQDLVEPEPEPDFDVVVELIRRLADGRQGAHLAQLVASGELGDWEQADLKAALARWYLPVEEFKLRLDGRQRVREGVRVRHLPAGAGEAPAAAGEGAPSGPPSAPARPPSSAPPEGPAESVADPSPPPAPEALSEAPVGG